MAAPGHGKTFTVVDLPVGQGIVAKDGSFACHVLDSQGSPDLSCHLGTLTDATVGTYNFQLSDHTLTAGASEGEVKTSLTEHEPRVTGSLWANGKQSTPVLRLTSPNEFFALSGSHVVCTTTEISGVFSLACGVSSPQENAYFQVKSYMLTFNSSKLVVARVTAPNTYTGIQTDIQPRTASPVIDRCLLGTWVEVGEQDAFTLDGTVITLHGSAGGQLHFSDAGVETESYAHALPLIGTLDGKELRLITTGTTTYHDSTSGDRLIFHSVDYAHSSESATYAGAPIGLTPRKLPPSDTFTCTRTTLTESGEGYASRFTR